ncbi:MAG: AraC family transcriptional regulator, partial [Clostridia bacterium]|nr:AraC family transcriptional regulator [Clostridia bacterium]
SALSASFNLKSGEFTKVAFVDYLLACLVEEYGVTDKRREGDSLVDEIVRFVYENYEKDLSLDFLANKFCVWRMALTRKLTKYLGVDRRVFVIDVRLREDKKNEGLSSAELCYKCGFKSYGTFYRAYQRYEELKGKKC